MCHLYLVESVLNVYFGGEWMDDPSEYDEGALIMLNDDDDNDNDIPDKDETGTVQGENDLVPLFVWTDPPAFWLEQGSLTLEIVSGTSKIKVWRYNDKRMELTLPKTWPIHQVLGETFYIEGVAVSGSLRDIELKLTYACGSESSVDRVKLTVHTVTIDIPDSYPALVCKGEKLQLGCTLTPPEAGRGTYQWSKVSGPGTVTFTPSASAEDPQFSANQPGKYAVKVEYTISGNTFSDTTLPGTQGPNGDIVVWELDFEEDESTTATIEGYPGGHPASGYGSWAPLHMETDNWQRCVFNMHTEGARFVGHNGPGSYLRACGEIRWDVYLDVGNADVNLKVSASWSCELDVGPESTLMERGAHGICNMILQYARHALDIIQGKKDLTQGTPNPVIWRDNASGRQRIGYLQAGVSYDDHGADLGHADAKMEATYSVSRD